VKGDKNISLTGCGNSKEVRKIKKETIKLAEQYFLTEI